MPAPYAVHGLSFLGAGDTPVLVLAGEGGTPVLGPDWGYSPQDNYLTFPPTRYAGGKKSYMLVEGTQWMNAYMGV